MTKKAAEAMFRENVLPFIDETDRPMVRTAWNDYVDSMQKEGMISERQAATWGHPKFVSR